MKRHISIFGLLAVLTTAFLTGCDDATPPKTEPVKPPTTAPSTNMPAPVAPATPAAPAK